MASEMQDFLATVGDAPWQLVSRLPGAVALTPIVSARAFGLHQIVLEEYGCAITWTPGVAERDALFWGGRLYAEHVRLCAEGKEAPLGSR